MKIVPNLKEKQKELQSWKKTDAKTALREKKALHSNFVNT